MKPFLPPAASWGRRLQLAGGLLLLISPFLAWARVPLLKLEVALPGLLLHGALVAAAALLALGVLATRLTLPGLQIAAAAGAAAVTWWDHRLIVERTEYYLGRLQLSLSGLNGFLIQMGLDPVEIFVRRPDPTGYVAEGVGVAGAGAALLAAGALLEAAGWARKKGFAGVLLGRPACRECGHRVAYSMAFCPGCGTSQRPGSACGTCGRWLEEAYRYCPDCGAES